MAAMNYPVVIHKDATSDYGVTVPDLPGCFSAGRTLDEALSEAKESIELHLEGLIEEGLPVPPPGKVEEHQHTPDFQGGTWAVVGIDPSSLRLRAVRINVTVPERVLDAVDAYAAAHGRTRSGLLVEAVTALIGRKPKTSGSAKRSQRPNESRKTQPAKPRARKKLRGED